MTENRRLAALRRMIDSLDCQIVRLLNKRARMALHVGRVKVSRGFAVRDPAREARVLANVRRAAKGPLSKALLLSLYRAVIEECGKLQAQHRRKG